MLRSRQAHLGAGPADVTTRRSGQCACGESTPRRAPPFCFVPGTRRVSVLNGPGPRWRLLLCSRCFFRAVPCSGSRPRFPWSPCGVLFEGSRPAPMLRRSASKGSALLYPVMSQHSKRGYLSLVGSRAVTGSPSFHPSTGLKLGARRSYKYGSWDSLSSPTSLLFLLALPKSRNVFLCLSRPAPRWGGLAFLGFDARRMLASSGGKLERACAPSLSFSGISRRALSPWGHASAMSLSLKGH